MSEEATLDEFVGRETEKEDAVYVGSLQQIEESPIAEWTLKKLGNILTLEYGDNLPANSRENGDIPVFGSNGQVDTHSEPAIDEPGIIMGRKGSIGEIEFSEKPFWPIDTTYYLTSNETDENLSFLYYLLQNIQLERLNAASAIPGLNRNDAYGLNALVPPLLEQRKIATVLYSVDRVIEKTEEIIDKSKQIVTETAQNVAITGIGHSDFEEIRLGPKKVRVPVEWEISKFGDLSDVQQGLQIAKSDRYRENAENRYQYITVQYLNDPQDPSNNWYIEDPRDTVICEKEDVLMTRTGNTGEVITGVEGAFHNNFFKIDFNRSILLKDYLVHYLESKVIQDVLISYAGTTTIPDLNHGEFFNIPVLLPPISEQREISQIVGSLSEKVSHEEEYLNRLQRLKRGLMQDLLSGTVRTTDTNIEVPEQIAQYG